MSEKYSKLKVKELQEILQKNGIPHSGKKEDLVERLVRHDERKALENLEKEFELDDDLDDSKLLLDETAESSLLPLNIGKESVLSDVEDDEDFLLEKSTAPENTTIKSAAVKSTTVKATTAAKPAVTTTETTITTAVVTEELKETEKAFKFTPITFEKKTATEPATKPAAAAPKPKPAKFTPAKSKTPTKEELAEKMRLEAERKLERSKRFGIKLDEKEMKEIRAARFGITEKKTEETAKENKKVLKAVAEKKLDPAQELLKKRAERFGLPEKKVPEPAKKGPAKKGPAKKGPAKKEPVKKEAKKSPVPAKKQPVVKKIPLNKTTSKILQRVQQGKVTKIQISTTKSKILNKRVPVQAAVEKKRNIINTRKVNILNNNHHGGRIITYTPNAAPVARPPATRPKKVNNVKAVNNNGRTVVIETKEPPKAHRKRGRGSEPEPHQQNSNNKKRFRR